MFHCDFNENKSGFDAVRTSIPVVLSHVESQRERWDLFFEGITQQMQGYLRSSNDSGCPRGLNVPLKHLKAILRNFEVEN